jgi:hypothetical protein
MALAVTGAVFFAVSQFSSPTTQSGSSLDFSSIAAQRAFARDHVRSEPQVFVVANAPTAPSFASRALL